MKVYQVKKKVTQTKSGVLGVPEAMMGVKPAYIYRDEAGEFLISLTEYLNPQIVGYEYIMTIWPRDEQHMLERFWEVVRWHEQASNV